MQPSLEDYKATGDSVEGAAEKVLTDPIDMYTNPDMLQSPEPYRMRYQIYNKTDEAVKNLSQRFECAAILTEHDMAARRRAEHILAHDPIYNNLKYGEAKYFCVYEALVQRELEQLVRQYGPPQCSYDGLTSLPLSALYTESLFDGSRYLQPGRRHSLACPSSQIHNAIPTVGPRSKVLRRYSVTPENMSLNYRLRKSLIRIPEAEGSNSSTATPPSKLSHLSYTVLEDPAEESPLSKYAIGKPGVVCAIGPDGPAACANRPGSGKDVALLGSPPTKLHAESNPSECTSVVSLSLTETVGESPIDLRQS